jgi:hypothetical protein
MNARQREKHRLTLLIRLDTDRSGRLPDWWWKHAQDALSHDPRWPLRSKRYRHAMREAGHAVGGGRPSFQRFALMGAGCAPCTWAQWARRGTASTPPG